MKNVDITFFYLWKSFELGVEKRKSKAWNSIISCFKFKVAFDKIEQEEKLYNEYFKKVENGKKDRTACYY